MPSSNNTSSLVRSDPVTAVVLTEHERAALIELGVRPTYALRQVEDPEGDVDLMLANALAWMQAAEITGAGRAGRIPPALGVDIALQLSEAIPETLDDIETAMRNFELWRAGDERHGFPDLGPQEIEARYEEYIERDRCLFHALNSIAAKLELAAGPGWERPGRGALA